MQFKLCFCLVWEIEEPGPLPPDGDSTHAHTAGALCARTTYVRRRCHRMLDEVITSLLVPGGLGLDAQSDRREE